MHQNDFQLGIVMGNPGVSRAQPVPIPQKPLPATHTGLPIKISPKTSKLVEKWWRYMLIDL